MDSAFNSCLKDMDLNPAEAGHCIITMGKLFTPAVRSGAEGQLNQLTPCIASTLIATLGKSFICIGLGLLSLSYLIGR